MLPCLRKIYSEHEVFGSFIKIYRSQKAQECLSQMLQIDGRFSRARHLHGLLFHAMGQHRKAINDLSMGLSVDCPNVECLYFRASCYHTLGQYK
ncbi:suppressor of RPS4-RLD 1-like isoform X2 [Vigna radiata var. radiata]|uniref:Suppressor of RPS4-RLD 1-like isoform X2 n=1 Tax=Vigna radiata var. radiata TaxID=3916 RepID=A0A3Q0ERR9_VIGRR|nr:suppressor of RPS4-RLD 1-like isoform X2 [Vigna radiata var. radiata]